MKVIAIEQENLRHELVLQKGTCKFIMKGELDERNYEKNRMASRISGVNTD